MTQTVRIDAIELTPNDQQLLAAAAEEDGYALGWVLEGDNGHPYAVIADTYEGRVWLDIALDTLPTERPYGVIADRIIDLD